MNPELSFLQQALLTTAWLCLPAVAGATGGGLLGNLVTAFTPLTDPVISQAGRLFGVGLSWFVAGPWITKELFALFQIALGAP